MVFGVCHFYEVEATRPFRNGNIGLAIYFTCPYLLAYCIINNGIKEAFCACRHAQYAMCGNRADNNRSVGLKAVGNSEISAVDIEEYVVSPFNFYAGGSDVGVRVSHGDNS